MEVDQFSTLEVPLSSLAKSVSRFFPNVWLLIGGLGDESGTAGPWKSVR